MANLVKYSAAYGALKSAFVTGDLDGLTDGSYKFGSGADVTIDNTTDLNLFIDLILNLGSFTPGSGGYFNIWPIVSLDGANYADPQSAAAPPAGTPVYSQGFISGASAKVNVVRNVLIVPGKQKLLFQSKAGATLATGGNTLKYVPSYGYNLNG